MTFSPEMLIPTAPLHPITILHYLLVLGALGLVIFSGDEGGTMFTALAGGIAFAAVVNIYGRLFGLPGFVLFIVRVLMVMFAVILTGTAPSEKTRSYAIILVLLALPILFVLFIPAFDPHF